jgi:hypothetical protein
VAGNKSAEAISIPSGHEQIGRNTIPGLAGRVRNTILQNSPKLNLRNRERPDLAPEDTEFFRCKKQFDVKPKRSDKPVEQRGHHRRLFESIPDLSDFVARNFQQPLISL